MGIMHLKRCSDGIFGHAHKYTLVLSWNRQNTLQRMLKTSKQTQHTNAYESRDLLTLVWQLANIRGDSHVQHVIDSRVNIVSSLDIVFAVGLVALLVAAVLQTVPLQVLECWCATWGPGGRRGKCWLTVTSPLTRCPLSPCLWWFVSCPSFSPSLPFLCPFYEFVTFYVVHFLWIENRQLVFDLL